jgi:hypothetical protein
VRIHFRILVLNLRFFQLALNFWQAKSNFADARPTRAEGYETMAMLTAEIKTGEGALVAMVTVPEKAFKTGSKGFYTNGKCEVHGKRYQMSVQLVEIGSKKAGQEVAE